jgi:ribosomal protein S27AE
MVDWITSYLLKNRKDNMKPTPEFPFGVVPKEEKKFQDNIKAEFPDKFCPKCGGPMWPFPHEASQYMCASCKYTE